MIVLQYTTVFQEEELCVRHEKIIGKRFGIELSYRQSHQAGIRTSTRNPLLRLLYFALSTLMRNCWLDFEREVLLADGRKKQTTSEYMSFKRLLQIIRRTIENFDCCFSPTNSPQMPQIKAPKAKLQTTEFATSAQKLNLFNINDK